MHESLTYIVNYLQHNWTAIGTYLLGGAGVSIVAELLIRWHKLTKDGWKELIAGTLSAVTAAADWVVNNYSTSPLASLGNVGPRLFAAAVLIHRLVVSPSFAKLEKVVTPYLTAVKTLKAETTPSPEVPPATPDAPESFE